MDLQRLRPRGPSRKTALPDRARSRADPSSVGRAFAGRTRSSWSRRTPTGPEQVVAELLQQGHACIKIYDNLTVPGIRALVDAAKSAGLPAIGHVPFGLTFEEALVPNTQHLMGFERPQDIEAGDNILHRVMDWSAVDEARIARWPTRRPPTDSPTRRPSSPSTSGGSSGTSRRRRRSPTPASFPASSAM